MVKIKNVGGDIRIKQSKADAKMCTAELFTVAEAVITQAYENLCKYGNENIKGHEQEVMVDMVKRMLEDLVDNGVLKENA